MEKKMKLSEAIRKGSKLRPQNFGWYYTRKGELGDSECKGSCVWGAAIEAVTGEPRIPPTFSFSEEFPVCDYKIAHPITKKFNEVFGVLVSLNDEFKWSREAIADYVESLGF